MEKPQALTQDEKDSRVESLGQESYNLQALQAKFPDLRDQLEPVIEALDAIVFKIIEN